MPLEQPPQVPLAYAQPLGQFTHTLFFQHSFRNQSKRAGYRCRCSDPGRGSRRALRTATQAGAKTCRGGSGRVGKEPAVTAQRDPCGTDGPAINAGGAHPGKKAAVEAGVPTGYRPVACLGIKIHGVIIHAAPGRVWPFSDLDNLFPGRILDRSPPPSRNGQLVVQYCPYF